MSTYTSLVNGKPVTIQLSGGDTLRDVADLYSVLQGEFNGTPSVASEQLKDMLGKLQVGQTLPGADFEVLNRIRKEYATELAAFRAGPHADTEGFVPVRDPGRGRILEAVRLHPGLHEGAYVTPSTTDQDRATTGPHLLDSVLHDLAHSTQHVKRLMDKDVKDDPQSQQFNAEHALNHNESAIEHAKKLDAHLKAHASKPETWSGERKVLQSVREYASLREGRAAPPPNLREAPPHSEAAEQTASTPVHECGTCKMFDANMGWCWGYGNMQVDEDWLCDSWTVDPNWKAQGNQADAAVGDLVALAEAQAREDSGKYFAGSHIYDPVLLKSDTTHAAEAAARLAEDGRIRISGQSDAAQAAVDVVKTRLAADTALRAVRLQGNPYTQLTVVREAEMPTTEHPELNLPKVCVDFDGVIHRGPHGLPGKVEGDLLPDAGKGLKALAQEHRVVVLTARTDFAAVRAWLDKQGVGQYVTQVTNVKPPAALYIDDRALHFNNWQDAIKAADPLTETTETMQAQAVPAAKSGGGDAGLSAVPVKEAVGLLLRMHG